ncbi:MAG TPA: hypothetical protein VGM98_18025 [Schlesneria sp.]
MDRIRRLCLVCGVMALSGLPLRAADPTLLKVQLESPADKATITEEEGRTVITVTSATGIGRMTLSTKDRWPKDITLRLRYAGNQPFKTLEGFDVTSSRMQVRTSSCDGNKTRFFLADDDGKFSRDDVNPTGWLKIEFKPHGDDLDIVFPSSLWRDEKEVRFQWIDFYRV